MQKNHEAIGLIESIIHVINMILQEYLNVSQHSEEPLPSAVVILDQTYVTAFLSTIQDRVEYIYA